jgi:hypothetical protein
MYARNLITPLAFLCVLGIGGLASATPYVAVSPPDEPPLPKRLEVNIGMLAGGTDVGEVSGPGVGVIGSAGLRMGPMSLLGEASYTSVGDSPQLSVPVRGRRSRVGGVVRYSLLDLNRERSPLSTDFWVEGGVGRQHIAWNRGGTLERWDGIAGFGLQLNGKLDRKTGQPRYFGPYFAFRANVARAPDSPMEPTCSGPCDKATRSSRADVSMFFHFGLNWGR